MKCGQPCPFGSGTTPQSRSNSGHSLWAKYACHSHPGSITAGMCRSTLLPVGWGRPQYPLAKRSEEHTSELQSLMRISYAVFFLQKKSTPNIQRTNNKNNTNQSLTN